MEKLKSIAKSIWAKIPKTKTEFKDLFDRCVSFLERWLHKIWAFLKSAYAWVINFYQKHSKLIHEILYAIAILIWFAVLVIILINLYELYFAKEKPDSWASEVRIAVFTLAAWFGTLFLVWRTMLASKQAETAQEQAVIAQEKAYTELFTQAVEQLGSVKPVGKDQYEVNIEVRVGALYALERIMHDSARDAPAIIDTLTTYVKHNCGKPRIFKEEISEDDVTELQEDPPANRYDIQTALTIIGRRPEKYKTKETMPDLTDVNLKEANLVRFDLSFCDFSYAHLNSAIMHSSNLKGAQLYGVNLQKAYLQEAKLEGAQLSTANLEGANLKGANLRKANLKDANFRKTRLGDSIFLEANLFLTDFSFANLERVDLRKTDMHLTKLKGTYLKSANLRGADLSNTDLSTTNLCEADMRGALLHEVIIRDNKINKANTNAASVNWVDFTKADYDFDRLQEQVMDMFGHKTETKLPVDMKIPDHWSEADMDTNEGREQYMREWEAFKKEKGVE